MTIYKSITINVNKPFYPVADLTPVLWNESGYNLNSPLNFSADPLLYGGAYMVQEASSMMLGEVLKQVQAKFETPIKVLDLSAAFGGNSTLLSTVLLPGALLVANEPTKPKAIQLKETITRWGLANTFVSNNNITDFCKIEGFFDAIVVANTGSKDEKNIIDYVLPALKPGGFLIYTASVVSDLDFVPPFNDLVNSKELKPVPLVFDAAWGIEEVETVSYIDYYAKVNTPHFHVNCFEKPYDALARGSDLRKTKLEFFHNKNRPLIEGWLAEHESFDLVLAEDEIIAIPKTIIEDYALLKRYLNLLKVGVKLGKITNGKTLIPDHELALFAGISSQVSGIEVDLQSAQLFLKKQDFPILSNFESGWQLVKYQGFALGWVKVIGQRMNNYYPKDIKIMKEF
ncbi:MAG: hypothetical protein RL711_692 [Bacteroidota bacterium]